MNETFVGEARLRWCSPQVSGVLVDVGGEPFYRIDNCDAMPPFLMSLVSDSDHWMFVSSTGALTAGRGDPDHALFPYCNEDRLHDGHDQTGGKTIVIVDHGEKSWLWEPLSPRCEGLYRVTRSLAKSVYGNKLMFEEVNHDLELSFSSTWMTSERFGFIRRAALVNLTGRPVAAEILDGIQNLMPHGLTRRFEMEFSTLADGYKENELDPVSGMGLFKLSSIPGDRPEPNEALAATTVWTEGIEASRRLLCAAQLDRFRRRIPVDDELFIRGRRGAYFVITRLALPSGASAEWSMVAEIDQDAARVAALGRLLASGADLRTLIDEDVERGTQNLVRTVAGADALQLTADRLSGWRHFSDALFNTMRGGIPDRGYSISTTDFRAFVTRASMAVSRRQAGFLGSLPDGLAHSRLLELAREQADPDLERLAHEYLPLTFSRRHGDPTRPWNNFSIVVRDDHGQRALSYEGNWRDIFQNWEALALSFPGYIESMIFKFVDASTADGHNPYRITRDGFDWEVLDPGDAWSYIGYWGDHQVVYLVRLLEASARYHPGALEQLLGRRVFTYADVPYRIRAYPRLLEDPRHTIDFDAALDHRIRQREAVLGADGRALPGPDGAPQRANLAEKLLIVALARLFNYIPEAGVWMNTQRPEWNDANNALVGYGVSMVTLYHLRRFLSFCRNLFIASGQAAIDISAEVAGALHRVTDVLTEYQRVVDGPISDGNRKMVLDALASAGSDYRTRIYSAGFSGERATVTTVELDGFCSVVLRHIDHTIHANRRPDGLYHAYNLMKSSEDGICVRRLYEMLEGQVAVLSSGALGAGSSADLLDALHASRLYRPDQNSYLLYPDRKLPSFLEKNRISADSLAASPTLVGMVEAGDHRIVVVDVDGVAHFNASLRNQAVLERALDALGLTGEDRAQILDLYEEVFDHQSFTGRSGTLYKYEGLGCIYWHMVSKLRVAVQEVINQAVRAGEDRAVIERLRRRYEDIREGIGVHKPPDLYGAIPTDPYSHTPSFAGAQQPGMTGQVKEDLISRLGDMGVAVEGGCLSFHTHLVNRDEFLAEAERYRFYDVEGEEQILDLEAGTLAFTTCQVPVVAHRRGPPRIEITARDGSRRSVEGLSLDTEASAHIFKRTGTVRRLDVFWGLG
ncbi:MAG: hypothetical protein WCB85_00020 [Candidatus Dormiibacterota bacterium]